MNQWKNEDLNKMNGIGSENISLRNIIIHSPYEKAALTTVFTELEISKSIVFHFHFDFKMTNI